MKLVPTLFLAASALLLSPPATASSLAAPPQGPGINVGSTGADGALNVPANTNLVVDLATQGTYDPANWRVVFNYTSVTIGANATVSFQNHPSRAPVVWLSQGDVVIEGTVDLSGKDGLVPPNIGHAEPGPGGFRGGSGSPSLATTRLNSGGFGPGGADRGILGQNFFGPVAGSGGGGGHASDGLPGGPPGTGAGGAGGLAYGDAAITWLIGGSGGGGAWSDDQGRPGAGGGAGGGAILIAANTMIHLMPGCIVRANGGRGAVVPASGWIYGGGGSGGSVRLLADQIQVDANAVVTADGGSNSLLQIVESAGASGRIRYEANSFTLSNQSSPAASTAAPGTVLPQPDPVTQIPPPSVWIHEIGGQPVPTDPRAGAGLGSASADIVLPSGLDTQVVIRTKHVPVTAQVFLYEIQANGGRARYQVADGQTPGLMLTMLPSPNPDMEAEVTTTLNLARKGTVLQVRVVLP